MPIEAKEFTYHAPWRARGRHPGRHTSTQRGLGMEFRGHAPLIAYPDPRRIDIRQTLRDPFDQVWVKIYNQKSAIPVYVVCDLSGSMGFAGKLNKMKVASEIVAAAAWSANRVNDPFGFIGFDDRVREDWLLTSSLRVHGAFELAERLQAFVPGRTGASGLKDVSQYLPKEKSLLLLISDFHTPLHELESAVSALARHHVVPMVLWDAAEYQNLPEFGVASITDAETGTRRTLFLRKDYREKIIQSFEARRAALKQILMRFDMPPMFVEAGFNANDVTEYFYQFMAA